MSVVSGLSAPARGVSTVCLVLAAFAWLVVGRSCAGDGRPTGFHSPNLAWGDGQLGLVWLSRTTDGEHLMFVRAGDDAQPQDVPRVLSRRAKRSSTPLVAFDGSRYLAAWTHRGRRAPGLWVRTFDPRGRMGEERRIVVGEDVEPCRQMVWTGEAHALAWTDGRSVLVGLLSGDGQLSAAPRTIEASGVMQCRLA